MSIKKIVTSEKIETLNSKCDCEGGCSCSCNLFAKGKKFQMDGSAWIVSEEKNSDGVQFRTIINTGTGDQSVRTVDSLLKDVEEGFITFV